MTQTAPQLIRPLYSRLWRRLRSRSGEAHALLSSGGEGGEALDDAAVSSGTRERLVEEDRRLAKGLLRERRARGSFYVSLAGTLACLLSVPFCIYVGVRFRVELGVALLGLVLGAALYEGGMMLLLRAGYHRRWLDWLNASLEVSMVTGVVLLDAHFVGPIYAFSSAPQLLYGPAILLSALRLSRTLTIYAGCLAGAQFVGTFLLYSGKLDRLTVNLVPSLSLPNFVQRGVYLVLAGVMASLVCTTFVEVLHDLFDTLRKELRARHTLGRHVSREVARHLLDSSQDGGDKRVLSVMFCDLRDFTGFSESLDPREVLQFLNHYFAIANRVVERHGGVINKFLGDGILALFGATRPLAPSEHARRAAAAALELEKAMDELRRRWSRPDLRCGIAVHSGEAVVGLVGSADRVEFTAIGDTVNVTSRLEALCKQHNAAILVSGRTAQLLGSAARTRPLGEATVRGRKASIDVFELLGLEQLPAPPLAAVAVAPRLR